MKPNPGGTITGNAIVDRVKEIKSIWRALENQGVVLISERRVGKTSVLRKMEEHPKDDWHPVLYIVEGKEHPADFVEGLYLELLKSDILKDKFIKLKQFYTKYVGGQNIGSWKVPQIMENWKPLFESMLDDVVNSGKKVLLMFDELPLMLAKFIKNDSIGPLGTMTFLDTLRAIRSKYEPSKKISFIYCGSIGIHLVIKDLKRNHGYNSDPINTMKIVPITGMDEAGARELCQKLSEGEHFQFDEKEKVFSLICRETDRLPFYIQHVFDYFHESENTKITENLVHKAIEILVNDPSDQGFFRHYLDRIKTYYDKDMMKIALLILNEASQIDDFWEEEYISNVVKSRMEADDEIIQEVLDLIWSDHYLIRKDGDSTRFYKFRYSLLKKWWGKNRGKKRGKHA